MKVVAEQADRSNMRSPSGGHAPITGKQRLFVVLLLLLGALLSLAVVRLIDPHGALHAAIASHGISTPQPGDSTTQRSER